MHGLKYIVKKSFFRTHLYVCKRSNSTGKKIHLFLISNYAQYTYFIIYAVGQAVSHAGCIYYSGGATLAINNIFKSGDTAPLNKYEYVSFSKVNLYKEAVAVKNKSKFISGAAT